MKCWFGAVVWKSVKNTDSHGLLPIYYTTHILQYIFKKREREFYRTRIPELTIGGEVHQTQHKEGMTVKSVGEKAACGI